MGKKILFFLLLIFVARASALEVFDYNISTRARGMGGVFAPFPSDTDAIFVNPAYFAYVDEISWDMVDVQVGLNGLQNYTAFQSLSSASGTSSYSGLYGKNLFLGGNGRTSISFPYFGFAAYNNFQLSGELNNPPFPDFNMGFFSDYGFALGIGVPLNPLMSVGMTLKRVQRWGGEQALGLSTIAAGASANIQGQFQNIGTGWGLDTAWMLKVPGPFSPSVVAVWKDAGCTAFQKISGTDSPPRIHDNLILGTGFLLDLPGLDVRFGGEFDHMTENDVQFGKKFHMGGEVSLPLIDLRAGVSQGYQTYGAGINLWFLRLDTAYYTVERGDYPGQTPDLRVEASLSLQLSVDADFKFTAKDGKRRKLKQRR